MKKLRFLFITLAIFGLSMSALAQRTYIITGSGTAFNAHKDGTELIALKPIQEVIDKIKIDAFGKDCIIQFGMGAGLDLGNNSVKLNGSSLGLAWGNITLKGKLHSNCTEVGEGTITLSSGVNVNTDAEISHSALFKGYAITVGLTCNLTISGGKISKGSANDGATIGLVFGTVNITGGTVEAEGADIRAIDIWQTGKVIISGDALVTSANTSTSLTSGTICTASNPCEPYVCLEIKGGTVENTADKGRAIYNNLYNGNIEMSGGTVKNKDLAAIYNAFKGIVTISGGTVKSEKNCAIYNQDEGKIIISGTAFLTSASLFSSNMSTVKLGDNGASTDCRLEIKGGTLENTAKGDVIRNESKGSITITNGILRVTGEDGATIYKTNKGGALTITGGFFSVTKGYVLLNESAANVVITNGIFSATTSFAVKCNGGASATLTGGIFFAYGKDKTDIFSGNVTFTGNAVAVAWDKAAGNDTYEVNTGDDIFKDPEEATAVWDKKGGKAGISVKNGAIEGFVPVEGVTITGVGIKETGNNDAVSIYPNPTNGQLIISNGELNIANVEIFNVTGQSVGANPRVCPDNTINISHLPMGVYFIRITTDNGVVMKKIVKE